SGTSLVASLLARSGCQMGEDMLPADANNRHGYFEDVGFLELNRRMLAAVVPPHDAGHPDWGWTEGMEPGGVDAGLLDEFIPEAEALIAARRSAATVAWGWKDPRTSVLLDFWDARLPDARYVFVYRPAWDVADSMQRLGAAEFLGHPAFAYRIWCHYNRAVLAFCRAHRGRTLLVSAAAAIREP